MRPFAIVALSLAMLTAGCQSDITPPLTPAEGADPAAFNVAAALGVNKQAYIVVFKDNVSDVNALVDALSRQYNVKAKFRYDVVIKGFAADLPEPALEGIRRNPNVAYVEPDIEMFALGATAGTQTLTSVQWGLDRIDQRALLRDNVYAYENGGENVEAYILDTGIRYSHLDFGGRASLFKNYINDGLVYTGDCQGHGTHVASTVGGTLHGVAKGVTLKDARVLGCSGSGSSSGIVAAINDITARKIANPSIPMVGNMSLGSTSIATYYITAIDNSVANGVVWSIAAGNSTMDACGFSPAGVGSAITVGASTSGDARASFSNFGPCVDLFAPGSSITAATYNGDNTYGAKSGTSMAAPHVAGVVALYLSANPTASAYTVREALVNAATPNVLTSIGTGSPNLLLHSLVATNGTTVPSGHHTLSVSVTGNGSGRITASGLDCGVASNGDCSEAYPAGTVVTLTATPGANNAVTWHGGCGSVSGNSCTVTLSQARSVIAGFNQPLLTVSRAGSGLGSVTSSPAGISCASDCSEAYPINTTVTLTATPITGGVFTGWSGCTTSSGTTCTVSMTSYSTRAVTANFSSGVSRTLAVTNAGGGTVTSNPAGISCGTTCSATFLDATSVTVTATPATGYRFKQWTGTCTSTATSCSFSMTADRAITAVFEALAPMHVSALEGRAVTGTTTWTAYATPTLRVSSSNALLSGAVVRMSWSGAASGTGSCTTDATGSCELAIPNASLSASTVNVTITGVTHTSYGLNSAASVLQQSVTLSHALSVSVTGSGTVASSPAGIDCGVVCTASFGSGTQVTLTATPATGQFFSGWSGACSGTGSCVVSMTAARSAAAAFAVTPPPSVHVSDLTGTGTNAGRTWTAVATVTVQGSAGANVSGVTVFFSYSGAATGTRSCTTDAAGTCSVSVTGLNAKKTALTFTVTGIAAAGAAYNAAGNVLSSVRVTKP